MNWRVKGATQKALSILPGGIRLNLMMQMVLGDLRNLDRQIALKVRDWALSMKYLREAGIPLENSRMFEIGSGWYPVLPVCFVLAGARSVATYDITRHLSEKGMLRCLDSLVPQIPLIAETAQKTPAFITEKLNALRQKNTLAEMLEQSRIDYHAPADARRSGLSADSLDIVYSNSVFEHIPREIIREILAESFRILRPGGFIMHNVACNDHYAHFDKSISYVNFLRFSENQWRVWNNRLQFQNRMRAPEFLALARDAGFEIAAQHTHVAAGSREALRSFTIAPEFRSFSESDLATTTIDFIGRKPAKEWPGQ